VPDFFQNLLLLFDRFVIVAMRLFQFFRFFFQSVLMLFINTFPFFLEVAVLLDQKYHRTKKTWKLECIFGRNKKY